MKAIILAAGEGRRLRPYTDTVPKCMVKFRGKEMIDYALERLRDLGIKDIVIVKGYLAEVLQKPGTKEVLNPAFATTNMVESFFCAESEFNDDLLILYSDIVFQRRVLETVLAQKQDFVIAADRDWLKLWTARMDNPLSDAETFRLNEDGSVRELGRKPRSMSEIEAQYMGIIRIKKDVLPKLRSFYHQLDRKALYDGRGFRQMFMTTFIQLIIDQLMPVHAALVSGGWVEIDSVEDLQRLEPSSVI